MGYTLFMENGTDTIYILAITSYNETSNSSAVMLAIDSCGEQGLIASNVMLPYDAGLQCHKLITDAFDYPVDLKYQAVSANTFNSALDILREREPLLNSQSLSPWVRAFRRIAHSLIDREWACEFELELDDELILDDWDTERTLLKVTAEQLPESAETIQLEEIGNPDNKFLLNKTGPKALELLQLSTGYKASMVMSVRNGIRTLAIENILSGADNLKHNVKPPRAIEVLQRLSDDEKAELRRLLDALDTSEK